MRVSIVLPFLFLLSFTSCKKYYTASDFEEKTEDHQTIAILPLQMEFSGVQPENLTPEIIKAIEENESLLFQASFFNKILESTRRGKKELRVDVQHYSKTLNLLEKNDVTIRDSWFEDPSKLAEILGVDAVVKGKIRKTRYMSDMESYGIEVGTQVLDIITESTIFSGLGTRNKDVKTNYALIEKDNGAVLWSIDYTQQADWSTSSEDLIDMINHRSARRFPYRVKRSR